MSIQYAILGFLSWSPLSGYDLKKRFAEWEFLYWSGNNNQIYRALVELHQNGLVSQEVQHQDSLPSRKIYTITEKGLAALREWALSPPELPQLRHPLLIQLAWAQMLDSEELDTLLGAYEEEVQVKLLMLREQAQRRPTTPNRPPRETALWDKIAGRWLAFYEQEWDWVRCLRAELHDTSH